MNNIVVNEEMSLIRKYTSKVKEYKNGISLAIGEPCIDVNKVIIDKTKEALDNKMYKYTNAQGDFELLDEICTKENVNRANVLVTSGASNGIFLSLFTLLNKDDEVIIINPSYPQYGPVIKFCYGVVRELETKDTNYIPTYCNLISLINTKTKVLILNTPSNPTGILYDISTLKMIDDICLKYNITILLDDVYEDICYVQKRKYIYKSNVIYLKSFSKSYAMTGYRLGYLIADEDIVSNILKVHSYLSISVPTFIQKAGVAAIKSKSVSKIDFVTNLRVICSFLLENNIDYIDVDGGIFLFINIKKFGLTSTEFCDRFLESYHVACVPGICFKDDDFIRVNFAIDKMDLYHALDRFQLFIDDLKEG